MNNFSKEERVAFEDLLEGFQDAMVASKAVATYQTDQQMMERANDTIWRPSPYILSSQDRVVGTPITFQDVKQLSVPSNIGFQKAVPFTLTALELREKLRDGQLGKAANERLSSDLNTSVRDVASMQGTIAVMISTAAGDYDDVAAVESLMDELGISGMDRKLILSSRDYNGLAGDLASRQTMQGKPSNAYEKSLVGEVANFEILKTDAGKRLAAAAGGAITIATNGAQTDYVPRADESATAGKINVDNRYQQVTVSATANVKAGDVFTIAGVEAIHHIHKEATGQLKTFRVISVDNGTTMTISPPIIGATDTPTDAELAYKNVEVTTESATAAITWLNTQDAAINPFWCKDSIEIIPGMYSVPTDQGVDVLRGSTDQGLEVVMTKVFNQKTFVSDYSLDCRWGVVDTQPEMNGLLMFGQS